MDRKPHTHVVMFSGGIGSWAAAKRVAEQAEDDDRLVLLFADVKGQATSPHIGEDEDTYRFVEEAAANVGGELVVVSDGRDIWEVFEDSKFLGNTRIAPCSHQLKQKPARAWIDEHCDPETTTVYVGIDWTETHRIPAIEKNYRPYRAVAPLCDAPLLDKDDLIAWAAREGLRPPRLYGLGFPHNNCGGGCVRAGQGQFIKLLEVMPERFAEWEAKEQHMRDVLGKDVSILRDRRGGKARPLTLRELRERHTDTPDQLDLFDIGGCGCFVDETPAE